MHDPTINLTTAGINIESTQYILIAYITFCFINSRLCAVSDDESNESIKPISTPTSVTAATIPSAPNFTEAEPSVKIELVEVGAPRHGRYFLHDERTVPTGLEPEADVCGTHGLYSVWDKDQSVTLDQDKPTQDQDNSDQMLQEDGTIKLTQGGY